MKMPFGKLKGIQLGEIIKDNPEYIVWLAENCDLHGELKQIVFTNYKKCLKAKQEDEDYSDNLSIFQRESCGDDEGWECNIPEDGGYD
jgi:uncharacterized protein (DUF3820 family)